MNASRKGSLSFKIHGLDCAEEIAILKRELGPLVGGEEALAFDLIQGKLTLQTPTSTDLTEPIREAVARTGMRAVPWEEQTGGGARADESFYRRHGRAAAAAISGICIALGFLIHAIEASSLLAPFTHGATGEPAPLASIFFYATGALAGAWFFLPKAWYSARCLRPDMNLLMTMAIGGAFIIGEAFEGAMVGFLFAVSLLLESWSVGRARRAIEALVGLSPQTARYLCPSDGEVLEVRVEEVPLGARVLVRPGEKVPLDGRVLTGTTSIDQSPITGESMPADKAPGDEVFAGTINMEGAFEFECSRLAGETTLARVIQLVEEAQARRAPTEQWIERFARRYTPAMMLLALAIAVGPPLFAGAAWLEWIYRALVILVIACPCALVISTPVAIVSALASAARAGVLIKGGAYLEAASRLKVFAFDKTGTLTRGRPEVQDVIPLDGHTAEELLERAGALETQSGHPLARSIVARAEREGVAIRPAEQFRLIAGKGAEGTIEGRRFWVGSHRYVHDIEAEDGACHQIALEKEDAGHSLVFVGNDRHICGLFCVADSLRDRAAAVVENLKRLGVGKIVMLTGDNTRTAEAIGGASGVDEVYAELLPEDKARIVARLEEQFGPVAMVGDGINDAPAMAASTLGIAMGAAGSDAAIQTADVALMSDDLDRLPWLVMHSRRTLAVIRQNVTFAVGLKLAFIALAFAGLATLWMAIAADMGASFLVILNGLRLLRPAP